MDETSHGQATQDAQDAADQAGRGAWAGRSEVRELLRTVLAAFPDCPPYGGDHPDPHPRLTISSSDVLAEAEAALLEEQPLVVRLEELTLWEEGPDLSWQQIGAVRLGQGG